MPWAKLSDDFYDEPAVLSAGNAAVGLWVRCIGYSSRHLTDGRVPRAALTLLVGPDDDLPALLDRLASAGLLVPDGDDVVLPTFLDYNPSAADVRASRADLTAKRSAAGRRGGIASGAARRAQRTPPPDPVPLHPAPDPGGDAPVRDRVRGRGPRPIGDVLDGAGLGG